MRIYFWVCLVLILMGCLNAEQEYSERIFYHPENNHKYIIRSYPDLELDSIWRYHSDDDLLTIYTADSLGRCIGPTTVLFSSGELYSEGVCVDGFAEGKWYFYKKSGELDFINFYSKGIHYQRWFLEEGDTTKRVYPIIDIKPNTAYVFDTILVQADYILEGLDTNNWDYYLHFDFIERDKYEAQNSLPYEKFIEKYEGNPIEEKFEFLVPGEIAMYGYTLAINRETGDSIIHLEIMDEYFTILDTTSTEL